MRKKALLVAPVISKLDHVRPALHRLSQDEGLDVSLRLVPLKQHLEEKLEVFCEFIRTQKSYGDLPGIHSVELISTKDQFTLSDNWYSNWSNLLSSLLAEKNELIGKESGIVILLSDQTPTGITLASLRSTLIIPNLRLIEFPVGYDLNSQGDNFDPSRQIKEQMIEYETWTGDGIRMPLLEISKSEKLINTLQIIRSIAENNATHSEENELNNLTLETVRRKDVWNEIINEDLVEEKSRKTSTNSLTNFLRRLQDANVLEKMEGSPAYRITEVGLIVSGLLSNANQ
jgi:hypothetical protein